MMAKITLKQLARKHNIKYKTLQNRLYRQKMSLDDALNTPVKGTEYPEDRFHRLYKVDSNGCHIWQGCIDKTGYGRFCYGTIDDKLRDIRLAHVFAKEMALGRKIPPNKMVLHRCDVKACCNPDHLYVGTRDDNVCDAHARGRYKKGVNKTSSKLDDDKVRTIRSGLYTVKELATMFNVNVSTVRHVLANRSWKHVV